MDANEQEKMVNVIARAAHAAWYAFAVLGLGEPGEDWHHSPQWQKDSVTTGVRMLLHRVEQMPAELVGELKEGKLSEHVMARLCSESHDEWMAYKASQGWTFGPEKDPEKKTHPDMVDYGELPASQRMKDDVFVRTVLTMWTFFV